VYERYLPEASPDIEASYQQSQAKLQCGRRGSVYGMILSQCRLRLEKGRKKNAPGWHTKRFQGIAGSLGQL